MLNVFLSLCTFGIDQNTKLYSFEFFCYKFKHSVHLSRSGKEAVQLLKAHTAQQILWLIHRSFLRGRYGT